MRQIRLPNRCRARTPKPFVLATKQLARRRTHLVGEVHTIWQLAKFVRVEADTACGRRLHSVHLLDAAPEQFELCDDCALADFLRPTVYRLYDDRDWLLYIGCTINLPIRLASHRKSSDWWPMVARFTTEEFDDHAEARAYEDAAIVEERPLFNRDLTVRAKRRARRRPDAGLLPESERVA